MVTSLASATLAALRVKIFADGADIARIMLYADNPLIQGFTTNPSLMRMAGVTDYERFARVALDAAKGKPVSLEVFADDLDEMERQARIIASWGENAVIKIPVTNTRGEFMGPVVSRLTSAGVAVNVTALMTVQQVRDVADVLYPTTSAYVSVFAGRIADTGRDPVPVMRESRGLLAKRRNAQLLWASPRQVYDIFTAYICDCHVITVGSDILSKLDLIGKDLTEYSLETVQQFHRDATAAGYAL